MTVLHVNGGIPLVTLSWTCKGTSVPGKALGTSTHTDTIDTSYNGQRCSCTASHPTWTVNKEVHSQMFVVHYPPTRDPVVSGYDGSVRYKGDIVTLNCQVSGGSPLANLSWTCDGQPQVVNPSVSGTTVTSVLTLTLQKGLNGKKCACHGRHSDTRYTPDISSGTFIVYYPPSAPGIFPSTSTPFPWIDAGQGTLDCKSQPGNPQTMTYLWIRDNEVIRGETRGSLVITSLTKNDNKNSYKCKISNDYTIHKNEDLLSQPIQLNVEYRPVINIGPTPVYVHENKSFERPCTADGNPSPVITWTPNINPSNGALLRLINIMRNQTGHYTCRAQAQSTGSHGVLSNEAVLNIIVQYPPSVQAILSLSSIKEGQDVSMTCLAQGIPDQYIYNGWTHIYRNQIIRSSNDFSTLSQNKRNLTLSGVSYQDFGTYRCSANNGIPDKNGNPNQTGEKDLDIKFSAVFNSSRTFYSELNKTVEIKIPFLSNPPVVAANISLTKNNIDQIMTDISVAVRNRNLGINFHGKVINVSGQEIVVTLHFCSSQLQGNYTIGVKNFHGGSLSTFVFQVKPSDVSIRKKVEELQTDQSISNVNITPIGIVIGFIVGVLTSSLVMLFLLWRKGFWNECKCNQGNNSSKIDNEQKTEYQDINEVIEETNVYDGIISEGAANSQESFRNNEYEHINQSQESAGYQQLGNKDKEDIRMSSVYVNTSFN